MTPPLGTVAAASLDFRATFAPVICALSAMVTVPFTLLPPTTEVLAKASCKPGITVI